MTKTPETDALLLDVMNTVDDLLAIVAVLRQRCRALDAHLRPCEPPAEEPETFVVTKDWLHQHATLRDGFTKKQLAVLGIAWPPMRGWLANLDGVTITREQKAAFERKGKR